MTDEPSPPTASDPTSSGDQRLVDLLGLVAERSASPGGGSVAAIAVSLAAALVEMAATYARGLLDDADVLVAESSRLRCRAVQLADADAAAYRNVIAVSKAANAGGRDASADEVAAAWREAAEVPLEIAQLGVETATLAAKLADDGKPSLRGDAVTALLLAEAAVRSAANLVKVNVESGGLDPELSWFATHYIDLAHAAGASDVTRG